MLVGQLSKGRLGVFTRQPLVQQLLSLYTARLPIVIAVNRFAILILRTAFDLNEDMTHIIQVAAVLGDPALLQFLLMLSEVISDHLVRHFHGIVPVFEIHISFVIGLHIGIVIIIGAARTHIGLDHGIDGRKTAAQRRSRKVITQVIQILPEALFQGHALLLGHQGH